LPHFLWEFWLCVRFFGFGWNRYPCFMIGNRDALGESRRRRVVLRLRKPRMRRQMARHLRRGSPPTDGQTFWRLTLGISFLRMRVSGTDWAHPAEIRPARRNVRGQMARPLLGGAPPTDGQTFSLSRAADKWTDLFAEPRQMDRPFPECRHRIRTDKWPDLFAGDRRRQLDRPLGV